MNEIDIFDIGSMSNASTLDGVWYKQTTSGQTPPGRQDFCIVLASSTYPSAHNM